MISELKEVLLFEQFIKLDGSPENWLKDVENQMQDTVAKLIGYAVSSFPKQSLDEWIVDYPQQTIMSTIHLILTHEINELFQDFKDQGLVDNKHGNDLNESEEEEEEPDEESKLTSNLNDWSQPVKDDLTETIQNISASFEV